MIWILYIVIGVGLYGVFLWSKGLAGKGASKWTEVSKQLEPYVNENSFIMKVVGDGIKFEVDGKASDSFRAFDITKMVTKLIMIPKGQHEVNIKKSNIMFNSGSFKTKYTINDFNFNFDFKSNYQYSFALYSRKDVKKIEENYDSVQIEEVEFFGGNSHDVVFVILGKIIIK